MEPHAALKARRPPRPCRETLCKHACELPLILSFMNKGQVIQGGNIAPPRNLTSAAPLPCGVRCELTLGIGTPAAHALRDRQYSHPPRMQAWFRGCQFGYSGQELNVAEKAVAADVYGPHTLTALILSRRMAAVVVVGTLLSGMSTRVVTPPAAAARVALTAPATHSHKGSCFVKSSTFISQPLSSASSLGASPQPAAARAALAAPAADGQPG